MKKSGSPPPVPDVSRPSPLPVPRVLQGVATLEGGIERRFSVRFLQNIEERLAATGASPAEVDELLRRFGTMTRSMLDREGHIVDAILASSHASQGLQIYLLFARLTAVVTPGSFRVEANVDRSWTITPPEGEPFSLPNTTGASTVLADGTPLQVEREGLLRAGEHALSMDAAESTARIGVSVMLVTMYCLASIGAVGRQPLAHALRPVFRAAATGAELRQALGVGLGYAGLREVGQALLAGATSLDALGPLAEPPGASAVVVSCLATIAISHLTPVEVSRLRELLDVAGQSAVPSRRCDPDAERALVMLRVASLAPSVCAVRTRAGALTDINATAKALRGVAREVVVSAIEHASLTLFAEG